MIAVQVGTNPVRPNYPSYGQNPNMQFMMQFMMQMMQVMMSQFQGGYGHQQPPFYGQQQPHGNGPNPMLMYQSAPFNYFGGGQQYMF